MVQSGLRRGVRFRHSPGREPSHDTALRPCGLVTRFDSKTRPRCGAEPEHQVVGLPWTGLQVVGDLYGAGERFSPRSVREQACSTVWSWR